MATFLERRVSPRVTSIISLIVLLIFLPLLLLVSYQAVQLITRAIGTPANIVIDTKNTLEAVDTTFFHAFSQGGEEATNMLEPVEDQVRALRPRLIRLDHIYDLYGVVSRSGSDLTFDWSRLDGAVDTILATGAKPLLALSFMPEVIARSGNVINPPNNWDEWALVVEKTIEHFSGKSERNLSGIYYEVWNEPDLPQFGKWGLSGDKNYLTLYRYAAIGARNAKNVNAFSLGGPATAGLYKNWVLALVGSGDRLNFLSWHSYLSNPTQFSQDQRNVISWLFPFPRYITIPKLITEYGFTGNKDSRYGAMYSAAHTAAVIRQLIAGRPQYIFTFQLKDGPNQLDGSGWGLITHETNGAKAKPRYYVFSFLDAMAGTRLLLSGEGTWVTGFATTKNNVIRLMLVNFDANGSHSEDVPVSVQNLDQGTYIWRERLLLGRDVKFTENAVNGSVSRQVFMPAQSVAIIELTKL